MEAIVINRKLTKKEIEKIKRTISSDTIIYKNPSVPDYFKSITKSEIIPENEEEKRKINYKVMQEILDFGELEINKLPISDIFTYKGFNLWQNVKFRTYFDVRNFFYEIVFIKKILPIYEKIFYFSQITEINDYFELNSKIIFCDIPKTKLDKNINYLQFTKYFIFFFLRIIIGFYSKQNSFAKYLVIDHSLRQSVIDIETLKIKKGNYNLDYLFKKLDDSFLILDDVNFPEKKPNYKFNFNLNLFKQKQKIFGEKIILKGIISSKIRKETKEIFNYFLKNHNKINQSNLNEYQKIILKFFQKHSKSSRIFIFKFTSYKYFFKKKHFNSILTIDENSPRISSILSAAKLNHIVTIGMQHGAFHNLHPAYLFTKQDIKRNFTADYTLVFGDYWKNFLIENGNYNNKSVIVTGQIRTDIIPKLLTINNKKNDNKIKSILFASQPQRDELLRKKAAIDVFKAVQKVKNSFLTIKLHPAEKYDKKYYEEIAKEVGITNYKITYWEDLYLLLSKSDIVITCFSTVGSETVYFYKPLIILDHLKQDIQNYHKEGIAFQATNAEELKSYINRILSGELKINKTAYEKYIKKYAYKIDGHATDRVIAFIKSF